MADLEKTAAIKRPIIMSDQGDSVRRTGRIDGYLKPLFKDVDVYDSKQDEHKGLLQKLYEGALDDTNDVLENIPHQEVATKVQLSGPVKNPRTNTWEVVTRLIQNVFFKAILPGFEREENMSIVNRPRRNETRLVGERMVRR